MWFIVMNLLENVVNYLWESSVIVVVVELVEKVFVFCVSNLMDNLGVDDLLKLFEWFWCKDSLWMGGVYVGFGLVLFWLLVE